MQAGTACIGRLREIAGDLDGKEAAIDKGLEALAEQWDQALGEHQPESAFTPLLARIKQRLDEYAYLDRLRTNVRKALGED